MSKGAQCWGWKPCDPGVTDEEAAALAEIDTLEEFQAYADINGLREGHLRRAEDVWRELRLRALIGPRPRPAQ
jgi:hypothetical protein